MYKFVLCWRYLRSRYIALASIVSVMLGVATMIVVNSVMQGFTHEMWDRMQGSIGDLIIESRSLEGFSNPQWHMDQIRLVAGDQIEQMTATVAVPAMLSFQHRGQWITRDIRLVGIDARTQGITSEFSDYLQHPENRKLLSWDLREGGYDAKNHHAGPESPERPELKEMAGWNLRRKRAEYEKALRELRSQGSSEVPRAPGLDDGLGQPLHSSAPGDAAAEGSSAAVSNAPVATAASDSPGPNGNAANTPADPFAAHQVEPERFDPSKEQYTGLVLGIALSSVRLNAGIERFLMLPGDDVKITFPTAGTPPKVVSETFTVVDFFESKMSEFDSKLVFVPIEKLQQLRGMIDPTTGVASVTSIQIKLKPGADGDAVRDALRHAYRCEKCGHGLCTTREYPLCEKCHHTTGMLPLFPVQFYSVETWKDKQGPLLSAVKMETAILNVLLFLIIAVAGFGILAIFYMIVIEKTRDIGILKSMGASGSGVMGVFLAYGLALGTVGAGVGLVLGLLFVEYLQEIADLLGRVTGQPVFDPSIYYFDRIPRVVEPFTVTWIVLGALVIAILASVLPARRAALMHPVEALRNE